MRPAMHEASIAKGILDAALGALRPHENDRAKISKITLAAGVLVGVEQESLDLYFRELSRGTAAEGAVLDVHLVPARLVCQSCGHEAPFDGADIAAGLAGCPRCGDRGRKLHGGHELFLESLETDAP